MSVRQPYPLKILIADDCQVSRKMLLLFLKGLGHQIDSATNGQECLTAALKSPYDLLISDIDMPEMSGIECARHIRAAGLKLPIIAITATSPDIIRNDCFAAGMNGFMPKPLNFPELKQRLLDISMEKLQTLPAA
jgi:CheY-like chemotaxis protein